MDVDNANTRTRAHAHPHPHPSLPAVLRAIYAYFLNYSHEELPYVQIPLHQVVKLTPKAYGCVEETFEMPVPATNTQRDRVL